MPSNTKVHAARGPSSRLAALAMSAVFAVALVLTVGVKPADAGHKWIGPAIAGAVIGGIIAHHAPRHYQHHGRYYYPKRYYHPKKYVRYHRPYRRHYGAPYFALHGPGFGIYIGR